jgi:hypothetical protein
MTIREKFEQMLFERGMFPEQAKAVMDRSKHRINKILFAKVRDHILAEPRRFRMERYVANPGYYGLEGDTAPPCGTVACIAGWAVALVDGMDAITAPGAYDHIAERAEELLGLSDDEGWALWRVFFHTEWPARFRRRYESAKRQGARARAAADYIDHIIATGKVTD